MPYIRVRPEGLQRMSEMLDRVEKDIEQREEAFSIVSRNLDWQVKREEDIDWQLRCICIELQEEKQKIAEIAEYLRRASVIYEKLEKNLQDEDERSLSYGTVYDQNEQETPFGTAYVAVYSWLLEVSKNIMKAVSEKNKDEVTGLAGDLVSYCDSLIKFFTGDSKHAPFGIGQWCKLSKASASVWKGFYTVFKKSFSDEKTQNLFEKKFGSWATAVGVAGGLMGILGAVTEYSRNGSSTASLSMSRSPLIAAATLMRCTDTETEQVAAQAMGSSMPSTMLMPKRSTKPGLSMIASAGRFRITPSLRTLKWPR